MEQVMNFDEAIDRIDVNGTLIDTLGVLQALQQEYAPTVEMTQTQKDLILRNQDEDKLYEIMGDGEGYYFNAEYWGNLEPHEVASAYLHPETIKVVDN